MERFDFRGIHGSESFCGVTRYPNNVFVLTELKSNSGTSVTNAIEKIVNLLLAQYNITNNDFTIIEEYEEVAGFPATIDLVTFGDGTIGKEEFPYIREPDWHQLKRAKFAELTGVAFEEHKATIKNIT